MMFTSYVKEVNALMEHIEGLLTQTGNAYQDVLDKLHEIYARGQEIIIDLPEEDNRKICEEILKNLRCLEIDYLTSVLDNLILEIEILMESIKEINKSRKNPFNYIHNAEISINQAGYVIEICNFLKRNIPVNSCLAVELNGIEAWTKKAHEMQDSLEKKKNNAEELIGTLASHINNKNLN